MQLGEIQPYFARLGVNVVSMTYDRPGTNARFMARRELNYPLLSDKSARHVRAMGILNREAKGRYRGIPHPGMVLVSPDGEVLGKFAKSGYVERPDLREVLKKTYEILKAREEAAAQPPTQGQTPAEPPAE